MSDRPMDWEEAAAARQLLAEEFVGTLIRQAKAQEDAIAKRTSRAASGAGRTR